MSNHGVARQLSVIDGLLSANLATMPREETPNFAENTTAIYKTDMFVSWFHVSLWHSRSTATPRDPCKAGPLYWLPALYDLLCIGASLALYLFHEHFSDLTSGQIICML